MGIEFSKPVVSVIVPAYNRERSIDAAVASVLSQTYQEIEVIVIDDASTDDTTWKVERIIRKDGRVRLIRLKCNQGGGSARNIGIDAAQGEIVAFLDSDDVWFPSKIEQQVSCILASQNPSRVAVYCRAIKWEGSECADVVPYWEIAQGEPVLDYMFCRDGFIQTSGLLLARDLAREVRFREIRRHQDYDFCIRLEKAGTTFLMVRDPLYIWDNQFYPDRISRNFDARQSLAWANEQEWPSTFSFEGYLKRHKIFITLGFNHGFTAALIPIALALMRGKIRLTFAVRSMREAFRRKSPDFDRAPGREKLLDAVRESGWTSAVICGAGRYFREILPQLLDAGLIISSVVDSRASGESFIVNGYSVVTLSDAIEMGEKRFIVASAEFGEEIYNEIVRAWPEGRPPPEVIYI
ncbi:glycosyltransferase family 2 protein [Thiorhodovibrio litoralis]|uniref:glycosyltransferase family 2 protein n=1 Tax=Thiorhodovibrio litoralis TaxID=2952932 RepID=UPI002B2634EC|nr:glycosyltransferase family 2 protein [Thiorhodovibrio litoralis]WPL14165.1 Putative glycosyltransferase EpsE [Thiorhodovibrio litoralis]